jgi:D-alanyl-D-alanine carboxypeptidase
MNRGQEGEDELIEDTPQPIRRRRSLAQPYQRPIIDNHVDDIPGVPKIRRASLYANPDKTRPLARVRGEDEPDMAAIPTRPNASARTRMLPETERRQPYASPTRTGTKRPPSRPLSARRAISAPPERFSRSRLLMIGVSALLVLTILGAAILALSRPRSSSALDIQGRGPATTPAATAQPAVNPHELVIVPEDTDHPPPPVYATAAYLLDANSGATLYAHNPFIHLPVMSTTKLMTAIVAIEKGNLNQNVTINRSIWNDIQQLSADSSLFGMKEGQTYTLRQLLYALLLVSGNDAAVAIADAVDGSVPRFVADMNQKAQQLHLYDTHFMNPHGLQQSGHYSSAHDLAFLGLAAFNIPLIKQITSTQIYTMPQTKGHPERFLVNDDQFFWWYPGVDAGKPGWDGVSNFVQVISVTRNHHTLIGVTIQTKDWWTDMRDLMNWGFDNFTWISPYNVDLQHPIPFDTLWNYFVSDKKTNTISMTNGRYYIYTGYGISGPIMSYFDHNGGLKQFGYPESMESFPNSAAVSQRFDHGTIQCNTTTNQCTVS